MNSNNQYLDIMEKDKENNSKILIDIVNNWEDYIKSNQDLMNNGVNSIYTAFEHYIKFGKKEGRQLKINTKYKNLINNDFTKTYKSDFIQLYEEYDWDKYIKTYSGEDCSVIISKNDLICFLSIYLTSFYVIILISSFIPVFCISLFSKNKFHLPLMI